MARNEQASANPGEEIGRKLSTKDMGFDKASILKLVLSDQDKEHFLWRVAGLAIEAKPFEGQDGKEGFGLLGQFEGTTRDGLTKDGSICYLPGYVTDMIVAALNGEQNVEIYMDIYVHYDETSATSYVFTVRNLLPSNKSALEAIKGRAGQLALPSS